MGIMTIADLKRANAREGYYFFSDETMSFFDSYVSPYLYRTSDTTGYIVVSDRYGIDAPRHFNVRRYDGGHVGLIESENYTTLKDARTEAKRLARAERTR